MGTAPISFRYQKLSHICIVKIMKKSGDKIGIGIGNKKSDGQWEQAVRSLVISNIERIQLNMVEGRWIGVERDAVQIVVFVIQLLILRATLLQLQNEKQQNAQPNRICHLFNDPWVLGVIHIKLIQTIKRITLLQTTYVARGKVLFSVVSVLPVNQELLTSPPDQEMLTHPFAPPDQEL